MLYSLILATLNRPRQISYCLESLFLQTVRDFEIVIIDQSDGNETENYIASLKNDSIVYRHVQFKGLSKTRNAGIELCHGEYILLIDDDAYYEKNYLKEISCHIDSKTVISGYVHSTVTNGPLAAYDDSKNGEYLNKSDVIRFCPSAGLTIPVSMVKSIGGFDTDFGLGGTYGSAEESDCLLRGMQKGYKVKYIKEARLKHPYPPGTDESNPLNAMEKSIIYAKGLGALLKKHVVYYRNYSLVLFLVKFMLSMLRSILSNPYNRKNMIRMIRNYHDGFWNYKRKKNEPEIGEQ